EAVTHPAPVGAASLGTATTAEGPRESRATAKLPLESARPTVTGCPSVTFAPTTDTRIKVASHSSVAPTPPSPRLQLARMLMLMTPPTFGVGAAMRLCLRPAGRGRWGTPTGLMSEGSSMFRMVSVADAASAAVLGGVDR